jgi:hypothetical protein
LFWHIKWKKKQGPPEETASQSSAVRMLDKSNGEVQSGAWLISTDSRRSFSEMGCLSARPFRKRQPSIFSTIIIIAIFGFFDLFFAGQVLPVAVVISWCFWCT